MTEHRLQPPFLPQSLAIKIRSAGQSQGTRSPGGEKESRGGGLGSSSPSLLQEQLPGRRSRRGLVGRVTPQMPRAPNMTEVAHAPEVSGPSCGSTGRTRWRPGPASSPAPLPRRVQSQPCQGVGSGSHQPPGVPEDLLLQEGHWESRTPGWTTRAGTAFGPATDKNAGPQVGHRREAHLHSLLGYRGPQAHSMFISVQARGKFRSPASCCRSGLN